MPFASPDELAVRLGLDSLTEGEKSRAEPLLDLASGLIRQETGQTIDQVPDDVLTRRGQEDARLRLPQRPVTSVSSVVLAGATISGYHLEGNTLIRDAPTPTTGRPRYGGGWGHPSETLVVTYTHGFAEIPATIKSICMEVVVRVWTNPGSVQAESYGSESVTYGQRSRSGLLLTEAERDDLARVLAPRKRSMELQ